jgi:hypothetical protein
MTYTIQNLTIDNNDMTADFELATPSGTMGDLSISFDLLSLIVAGDRDTLAALQEVYAKFNA